MSERNEYRNVLLLEGVIWNTWRFPERCPFSTEYRGREYENSRVERELRSYPRAKNITYTRDFRVAGWSTQRPTSSAALSLSHSLFLLSSSSRLIPRCQRRWRRLRTMAQSRCPLAKLKYLAFGRALKVHARGEPEDLSRPRALKDCTILGF